MRHLLSLFLFCSASIAHASITASGISAGAYMAQQFHMAYSSEVKGVGLIAGGPYYCAKGSMINALNKCMKTTLGKPSKEDSVKTARLLEKQGEIDPISNLKAAKVYILSGVHDETVSRKVADVTVETYRNWGVAKSNLVYETSLEVGHAFPTDSFGNACSAGAKAPYISNCNRDIAGEILNHLLGKLKPKARALASQVYSFEQSEEKESFNKTGYAYVPKNCERGMNHTCRIHVAFHGCLQTTEDIGTDFVTKTGYNSWAEANDIIVLYPQVKKNLLLNPNGCWDWWGYTGANYHTKSGLQVRFVKHLVEALREGKLLLKNPEIID